MIKNIKILRPGYLIRSINGVILDARSTIILVQTKTSNILIDTSAKKDAKILLDALRRKKLTFNDIDIIINTHGHMDHIGNIELFKTAKIYSHYLNKFVKSAIKIRKFPFKINDGIKLIETPGHSFDSISVILKWNKVYVASGDCIPLKSNLINWIPPIMNIDPVRAIQSMKKITKIADVIIPGHDKPFKINKEDFLK
ncbi:MAG: MBL fold metallo-hydrolase [Candidatus Lokiarchaeota archaeon]|nr:MBL fold metallo-hydrolase [Candidatus Lokiarchaeota archaeon]